MLKNLRRTGQQTKIKRTKIFQQRKFKTTKYLRYENFCIVEMSILSSRRVGGVAVVHPSITSHRFGEQGSGEGNQRERRYKEAWCYPRRSIDPLCCGAPSRSHRAKLLQELDSICFCTHGDHEYKILFEVLPSGTRVLVVCTQNFVVKKISLLKNLRRTRSQTKIF